MLADSVDRSFRNFIYYSRSLASHHILHHSRDCYPVHTSQFYVDQATFHGGSSALGTLG